MKNNQTHKAVPEQIAINLKKNELILYHASGKRGSNFFDIVMTDKKIYAYRKPGGYLVLFEYSSIKGVSFKKKKKINGSNEDRGDLIFYVDESLGFSKNLVFIPNVLNISSVISKMESILWHYGGFNSRELNIEFPCEFQISSDEFFLINKVYRGYLRMFLIGLTIFIIGTIPLSTSLEMFPSPIAIIWLLVFITGLLLILLYGFWTITLMRLLRSREKNLVLYENRIQSDELELEFDKKILISIKSTTIRFHSGDSGLYEIGIICFASGSLSYEFKFGPTSEFIKVIEKIFITYLRWKNTNNLLDSMKNITITQDLKEIPVKNSIEHLFLAPKNKILPQFASVISHLEEDEDIFASYKPQLKLLDYYIFMGFSVLLIPCSIMLFSLGDLYSNELLIIIGICVTVGTVGMCMGSVFFIFVVWFKKKMGNISFLFTDRNLVMQFPKVIVKIPYPNIEYINYKEYDDKYGLEFILKNPLEIRLPFPFVFDTEVYIDGILKSVDLYNQVLFIKEHFFKEKHD